MATFFVRVFTVAQQYHTEHVSCQWYLKHFRISLPFHKLLMKKAKKLPAKWAGDVIVHERKTAIVCELELFLPILLVTALLGRLSINVSTSAFHVFVPHFHCSFNQPLSQLGSNCISFIIRSRASWHLSNDFKRKSASELRKSAQLPSAKQSTNPLIRMEESLWSTAFR